MYIDSKNTSIKNLLEKKNIFYEQHPPSLHTYLKTCPICTHLFPFVSTLSPFLPGFALKSKPTCAAGSFVSQLMSNVFVRVALAKGRGKRLVFHANASEIYQSKFFKENEFEFENGLLHRPLNKGSMAYSTVGSFLSLPRVIQIIHKAKTTNFC